MPIEKQSLNNFLPEGFETLNQEGYKENFNEDKIKTGYEKDVPDIVSGPNLNNLIDVVGKNTNTLNSYVEYLNGMPINNVPTVNEFNQLDYTNLDDKLTKKQITNCLLEVPQRIKVEIENGIFILKAGSEVTIPNGFEADGTTKKYDYITIEKDLTLNSSLGNVTSLHFYQATTQTLTRRVINGCYTSETAPTTSIKENDMWYDTKNNYIKRYVNGTWSEHNFSLPFCIATDTTEGYTTIEQIFNSMGFIGSIVWIDKGVKGLIPNGRNEDGTLKNIEVITDRLTLYNILSFTDLETAIIGLYKTGEFLGISVRSLYLGELNEKPSTVPEYSSFYNVVENKWYIANSGAWVEMSFCISGSIKLKRSNNISTVSSLVLKQPFRALNHSDKSEVSGWGMPSNKYIDLTLGASGAEYTAPANGYVFIGKNSTATGQKVNIFSINPVTQASTCWSTNNDQALNAGISVKKGQKFTCHYSAGGTLQEFRFVYAEGEI